MTQEDEYKLDRNAAETERLHAQHEILVRSVGYLLHRSIQRNLPTSPHIADIGTGAGDFLLDLAQNLPPTARLDGYDISATSFVPESERPKNLTLNVSDARSPPNDELKGRYDLVCMRFINPGLRPEDWKPVAEHAWALLKPGGALQWIEGDLPQLLTPLRTVPETKTSAAEKMSSIAAASLVHASWFVGNLRPVLEEVGFADVQHLVSSSDRVPEDRKGVGRMNTGAFHAIATLQVRKGGYGDVTEAEVDRLKEEMMEEVENGAYMRADMHQFVARKPS